MKGSGNLVVLLQPRAAAQDLRQPELADGALHVANFPLSRGGRSDPLGRLTADTAYHVGMGEGLGGTLGGLDIKIRGNGLGYARMERGGAAGDHEGVFALIARGGPVAGGRTHKRRVISQRRSHGAEVSNATGVSRDWIGVYIYRAWTSGSR